MLWLGFKQKNLFCDFVTFCHLTCLLLSKSVCRDICTGVGGGCVGVVCVCGEATAMETTVFCIFSIAFPAVVCFLYSDTSSLVSSLKLCKINSLLLWVDICKLIHSHSVKETSVGEANVEKKVFQYLMFWSFYIYKLWQTEKLLLQYSGTFLSSCDVKEL